MAVSRRLCFAAALAAFFLPFLSLVAIGQVPPIRRPPLVEPRTELTRRLTIEQKYAALGGAGGVLGAARSPEGLLPDRTGRYRIYANGMILWHPETGAHELHGAIYRKFTSMSPPAPPGSPRLLVPSIAALGYPTTDETPTGDGRGVYNAFQRGVIYYLPELASDFESSGGAREIHGEIYQKWKALYHTGFDLGYPVTDESLTADRRGRFSHFERGSIYWTREAGAYEIHGSINDRWKLLRSDRGPLGFPTSDVQNVAGVMRSRFEHGSIDARTIPASLTLFQQNMALLVAPAPYKGTERERAIDTLIQNLRREQPDVVGLSECFADGERAEIKRELASIYPHTVEGPDEDDLESDGGLLILSRHQITQRHQTVYRQCRGEDCLANKGALHIRIEPRGHPTGYDVFHSHLQSPDPTLATPERGPLTSSRDKIRLQLTHLSSFIQAFSSPERPAILMGDLNTNGINPTLYADFLERLRRPVDLWQTSGRGPGITFDDANTFQGGPTYDVSSSVRHRRGSRLDYFLLWPGSRFVPTFTDSQVIVWQSSPGRDMSDHYGLRTRQRDLNEVTVNVDRRIGRVQVSLTAFHCLKETTGPTGTASEILENDEVEFELRVIPARGSRASERAPRVEEVGRGRQHTFARPPTVSLTDPGESIEIVVEGWEVDPVSVPVVGEVGSTGRASMGIPSIRLSRNDLLELIGRPTTRGLPLFRAGGEYVATVQISVTMPVEVRPPGTP